MQRQRWTRRPRTSTLSLTLGPDPAQARERAAAWAMALVEDAETVFLDTETTGFPPHAEIVDLAIIDGAGTVLLDTLVRPLAPIPAGARAVHGIGDGDVRDAPTWGELGAELDRYLRDRTVVVYNVEFDRRMIEASCGRAAFPAPPARWECAMRAYADYRGVVHPKTGQFRWQSLEHAAIQCGVTPGGHRALADAEACRQVVRHMAGG